MYSRYNGGSDGRGLDLKRHGNDNIPPNYAGSVFDIDRGNHRADPEPRPPKDPPHPVRPPSGPGPVLHGASGGLHSDDLLLVGLIILLLAGGADDDIVIMIAVLLLCTLGG